MSVLFTLRVCPRYKAVYHYTNNYREKTFKLHYLIQFRRTFIYLIFYFTKIIFKHFQKQKLWFIRLKTMIYIVILKWQKFVLEVLALAVFRLAVSISAHWNTGLSKNYLQQVTYRLFKNLSTYSFNAIFFVFNGGNFLILASLLWCCPFKSCI